MDKVINSVVQTIGNSHNVEIGVYVIVVKTIMHPYVYSDSLVWVTHYKLVKIVIIGNMLDWVDP